MKAEWFGGRLRELREMAELTQTELAERVPGMAGRTITHLEAGDRSPTWETVLALCLALGAQPNDFAREPAPRPKTGRGRPRKAQKAVRGRPGKALPAIEGARLARKGKRKNDKGDG